MRSRLVLVVLLASCTHDHNQNPPAPQQAPAVDLARAVDLAAPPDLSLVTARQAALEDARNVGLFKALNSKSHFGTGLRAFDRELSDLAGNQGGDSFGVGGLGFRGSGLGGGGGTIGLGQVGLIGRGGGGGSGMGYGGGSGRLGRTSPQAVIKHEVSAVSGGLDRAVVIRILRGHLNEARYCYDKELLRKPDLAGAVAIDFTIGADGNVTASTVTSATVPGGEVDKCLAGAVKRWQFPTPATPEVKVSTQYTFAPAAEGTTP